MLQLLEKQGPRNPRNHHYPIRLSLFAMESVKNSDFKYAIVVVISDAVAQVAIDENSKNCCTFLALQLSSLGLL